jgi:hypothetical protein
MSKKTSTISQPHVIIDNNMRDYSNDPLVIKKAERAAKFLKKHPLPKEFTKPQKKSK